MAKANLKITFECPACKQINEAASFSKAIDIDARLVYIGTGEYVPCVDSVVVICSGCKAVTDIDF